MLFLSHSSYWVMFLSDRFARLRAVWYVCLKIENCCLKIFVKIRVGEKVC